MPLWLPILAPRLHDIPVTALAKPTTPSAPELILQCLAEGKGPSCREQNCTGLARLGWFGVTGQDRGSAAVAQSAQLLACLQRNSWSPKASAP